ncbi:MAG: thermonuclease family protein [Candidatus Omnitrophica bacterium]|nr:thermonuclease family protein [Candidatus Omnitrophota bacterium]
MFRYIFYGIFLATMAAPAVFVPSSCAQTSLVALNGQDGRYNDILVQEVVNADTLVLENGETVRLIGVRALGQPQKKKRLQRDANGFVIEEKPDPQTSVEERAAQFAGELLEGKHVRLEFDAAPKDDRYRTLAYVFLIEGDVFVNAEILRRGFGDLHIQPPNLKYAAQLREAYREASAYRRGMDE